MIRAIRAIFCAAQFAQCIFLSARYLKCIAASSKKGDAMKRIVTTLQKNSQAEARHPGVDVAEPPSQPSAPPGTSSSGDDDADEGASDLLWGARSIAKFLNRDARAVFHLAATKQIPVEHVGNRLVARKSNLLKIAG